MCFLIFRRDHFTSCVHIFVVCWRTLSLGGMNWVNAIKADPQTRIRLLFFHKCRICVWNAYYHNRFIIKLTSITKLTEIILPSCMLFLSNTVLYLLHSGFLSSVWSCLSSDEFRNLYLYIFFNLFGCDIIYTALNLFSLLACKYQRPLLMETGNYPESHNQHHAETVNKTCFHMQKIQMKILYTKTMLNSLSV